MRGREYTSITFVRAHTEGMNASAKFRQKQFVLIVNEHVLTPALLISLLPLLHTIGTCTYCNVGPFHPQEDHPNYGSDLHVGPVNVLRLAKTAGFGSRGKLFEISAKHKSWVLAAVRGKL